MKHLSTGLLITIFALLLFLPNSSWSQIAGIEGTWYIGEKPVSIEVFDNGWRFIIIDESGNRSSGKAFNEEVIYLTEENITGQVEVGSTVIHWSDGTYWSREAFTGDEPSGLSDE